MTLRELFGRLAAWRRRDELDRDLASDLEAHVALLARDLELEGVSHDDALVRARRQLGNVTGLREESRDAWGFPSVEALFQDIRFAIRGLKRSPVFAATIIATIALGVGAATAIFTVVNGVLLTPLPYRNPGELVAIYTVFPQWKGRATVGELWNVLRTTYPDYVRYRDAQTRLSEVAGFDIKPMSATLGDETTQLTMAQGTSNLVSTLGVTMVRGRWFLPGEEGRDSPRLVVLSNRMWRSRFDGDDHVMGSTITLDEQPYTVVGVLPPEFAIEGKRVGTRDDVQPDLWIPIGADGRGFEVENHTLDIVGRLKPGVTIAAAFAEAEPLLRGDAPPERSTVRMIPRVDAEVGAVRRPLWLLFGAVALFLAITCGNVAALYLGECATRQPELRTRAALGAGRGRLLRLLLTESVVIAVGGSAAGALLAWWGTRVMLALAPSELPHAAMIGVDWKVLVFTIGVAGVVAIVSGLAPALLFAGDGGGASALAGGRVAHGRSRVQMVGIGVQAAGAIVLLVGAGLLGRSLFNERAVDPGFTPGNALEMAIGLPRSKAPAEADTRRLYDAVANALAAAPGVSVVTAMSTPPLSGRTNGQAVRPLPIDDPTQPAVDAENAVVLANYFEAMRVAVLAGRTFTAADTAGAPPVAIVNEAMARRFWPGATAIAKQFKHPNGIATIVGVVADVRNKSLDHAAEPLFYLPAAQSTSQLTFIVRTAGGAAALAPIARRAVWNAVPGASISNVTTTAALLDRALAPSRYRASLASAFAVLAIVLTVVGVAGLTARGVTYRRRELCIRMALGATETSTLALAMQRAVGAALTGAAVGLVCAPFTSRWLADYLYDVRATDVTTYGLAFGLTLSGCVVAAMLAARPLRHADLAGVLREQ